MPIARPDRGGGDRGRTGPGRALRRRARDPHEVVAVGLRDGRRPGEREGDPGELDGIRPDDEVLAEESGSRAGSGPLRWLIDPVDGTMNFVHGRRDHAVSVGVEPVGGAGAGRAGLDRRGDRTAGSRRGVLGRRPDGAHGRWRDRGVTGGARPVSVSGCDRLADAIIGVGYPRGAGPRAEAHVWFGELLDDIRDYRRIGSSACDLVNVASGVQDGYVAFGVKPWDVAGGFAIVRAAGGRASWVRTASGEMWPWPERTSCSPRWPSGSRAARSADERGKRHRRRLAAAPRTRR